MPDTHVVTNQAPPFLGHNPAAAPVLVEALIREGGEWGLPEVTELGALSGTAQAQRWGELADRNNAALRGILEAATKGKGPIDSKLGAFWLACNDEAAHDKAGITPLNPVLSQITAVKDEASLMKVVGSRLDISATFFLSREGA